MSKPEKLPKALPAPVEDVCKAFRLMAGHEVHGLAPSQIAEAVGRHPSWVTTTMPGLEALGFVERIPDTGRWRLGPAFVRIAHTVATNLTKARQQLDELADRYRTPL